MSGSNPADGVIDRFLEDDAPSTETPAGDTGTAGSGDTPDSSDGDASNQNPLRPNADKTDSQTPRPGTQQKPGDAAAQRAGKQGQPGSDAKPPANAQRGQAGDLIDPRTGAVIARAGAERRHYEGRLQAERGVQQAQTHIQNLETQLRTYQEAAQLPAQLKLNPDETVTAMQMMAAWKSNPIETVKYLLEQAKAAGHNVDALAGPGTDMGAIRAMITEAVGPLRQRQDQENAQTQAGYHAQEELNSFIGQYGQDVVNANGGILADLITRSTQSGQPLNLEGAYIRFENWCLRNQLDPSQPIRDQVAARQSGEQQPQTAMPARPNGRPASSGNGASIAHDPNAGKTGSERTRDLVREAMRENGFNL